MIRSKLNSFGDEMPDGRLTVHSNKVYRLHDAIAYKEEVGRTLTAKEMAQFEIKPARKWLKPFHSLVSKRTVL